MKKIFSVKKTIYLFLTIIFVFLAWRAVFSERTLIGNLEPYPDTLYYSVPAFNLAGGEGFRMAFDDFEIKQITPPIYSLLLVPFFAVSQDPRTFYFLNLILMYGSLIFVVETIYVIFNKQEIKKHILAAFVGFLFVTNYYVFTIPTLLMAETLTLFLTAAGMYLLFAGKTDKKSFLASVLVWLLFLVKFSNLPLTLAFFILFFIKYRTRRFLIYSLIGFSLVVYYLIFSEVFVGHKNLQSGASFSLQYVRENFQFYIKSFFGGQTRYLWYSEKYLPLVLAGMSLGGIIVGLMGKHHRKLVMKSLMMIISLIFFMSAFVTADLRYIIALLPFSLILIAVFTDMFLSWSKKLGSLFMLLAIIIMMLVPISSYRAGSSYISVLKSQVGLNFKFTEAPWNYLAVKEFDKFFANKKEQENRSANINYLATFLPPFYIDMMQKTNNYTPLPISEKQEFFWTDDGLAIEMKLKTWDQIANKYRGLIQKGHHVYISNYYINATGFFPDHFHRFREYFEFEKVHEGCLNACDIYELILAD